MALRGANPPAAAAPCGGHAHVDSVLHIFEDLCNPFGKLGITEANKLVSYQLEMKLLLSPSLVVVHFGGACCEEGEGGGFIVAWPSLTLHVAQMADPDPMSFLNHPLPALPEGKVYMPFPVLHSEEAFGLIKWPARGCSGGLRKVDAHPAVSFFERHQLEALSRTLRDAGAQLAAATFKASRAAHGHDHHSAGPGRCRGGHVPASAVQLQHHA